jgi:hypothetical protein
VRHFSDGVSEILEIQREKGPKAREWHVYSKSGFPARGLPTNDITTSKGSLWDISPMRAQKFPRCDARQASERENALKPAFPPGGCRRVTSQLPKKVCATFLRWGLGNSRDPTRDVSKRANVVFAAKMAFPLADRRQRRSQLPKEVCATFLGIGGGFLGIGDG